MIEIIKIKIGKRLREIDKNKVKELAESIKEIGLLQPILIDKENNLIVGLYRIKAMELLGNKEIDFRRIDTDDLRKELMEIDENLIRAELHYTDRGDHFSRRKEIYEMLYPETKKGISQALGMNKKIGNVKTESVPTKKSFVKDTVNKTKFSESKIKEEIQISNNITPEAKQVIREKNIPKIDALKLAREPPEVQKKAIEKIKESPKKLKASTAINQVKQEKKVEEIKEQAKIEKVILGLILDGDFFDKISEIENNSVDLLFVDPPYMILNDEWDTFKNLQEFMKFTKRWLDLVIPKVKQSGRIYICFSQWYKYDLYNLLRDNNFYGFKFAQEIIWNYRNNVKPSNQKKYRYVYEPIFYLYGKKAEALNFTHETYSEINSNVWIIATPQSNFKEGKFTSAQKPLELLKRIIMTGSKENDLILDPFAGSGTAGIICEKLNRKYILIEKNKDLIEIIKGRINSVERESL